LAVEAGYLEVPTGPALSAFMVQTVLPMMIFALAIAIILRVMREIKRE